MISRSKLFSLILFLPLLCCDGSPEAARNGYIAREGEMFAFHDPAIVIYNQARVLLAEHGAELPATAEFVDRTISTPWQPAANDSKRFSVRIIELEKSGRLIHIIESRRDIDGNLYERERRTDIEWELIQRLEPDRALTIAARAAKRGDDIHSRNQRRFR